MSPTLRSLHRRRSAVQLAALLASGFALATPAAFDCSLVTIGVAPLCDMGAAPYLAGHQGGLYPGGTNQRPAVHEAAGLALVASHVLPRDAKGAVDLAGGEIGMVSIGMSNTSQEFAEFVPRASADPATNPRLVIVNGAQGGRPADAWNEPSDETWDVLDARLAAAGLTPAQVQVAWIKQAEAGPERFGAFPAHAEVLQADLEGIVRSLRARYPNAILAYLSSRTRAYTDVASSLNPEPFAFESGFSVRWMIEKQLAGDPSLDFTPGTGVAPWISWGPYIWNDGEVPRSDGFQWFCSDLGGDFTHPSASGRAKVAEQLVAFFKTDVTSVPWFLRSSVAGSPPTVGVTADVTTGDAPFTVQFDATPSDDGEIVEIAWTFDDGCFSFDEDPTKTFAAPGVYDAQVTVTDDDGNTARAVVAIAVSTAGDAPPVILTESPLPGGVVGAAFALTMSASGTPPIQWAVSAGSPPAGLALSSTGLYSGTPGAPGTFTFTVEATNDFGGDARVFEHTIADAPDIVLLEPVADAFVRDGAQADTSFGSDTRLALRAGSTGSNARPYLEFDLGALPAACTSARLRLFLESLGGAPFAAHVFSVEDDSWTESGLTWNNRPPEVLDLASATLGAPGTSYEWDVTAFVQGEAAGDGRASFALLDPALAGTPAIFSSREGATPPVLEIACADDPTTPYCFCATGAPCANPDPDAGCASSTGSGSLLAGSGSASVTADDLFLSATNVPPGQFGIFFMGPVETEVPFGDGQLCVGAGATGLFRYRVQSSGPAGVLVEGPIVGTSLARFPPAGRIAAGATWNFQNWHRDPGGPCGSAFNTSNGVSVTFVP